MSVNFTSLATGALSFTVALAWNNAVSKGISSIFPNISATSAALVYAVAVTIVVVILVTIINCVNGVANGHRDSYEDFDDDVADTPIADGFGKADLSYHSSYHPVTLPWSRRYTGR